MKGFPFRYIFAAATFALPAFAVAQVAPFDLVQPIDCVVGETCVIQNYVDRDPGPGAKDLACGHLTYDGHQGTDFRLQDLAQMRRGVAVVAAAAGKVLGVRDKMADVDVRIIGREALAGRDCGNGVGIDHGNGWTTQYCHMKRGSIRVRLGQQVRAGDKLGEVGLSGRTEFPHLHLSLRHGKTDVDPFLGPAARTGCGKTGRSMWRDAETKNLVYRGAGIIGAGFSDHTPIGTEVEEGVYSATSLNRQSSALVFLVSYFGIRKGDRVRLWIVAPDGKTLVSSPPKTSGRSRVYSSSFVGRRVPKKGGWPVGEYIGRFLLIRDGRVVARARRTVRLR